MDPTLEELGTKLDTIQTSMVTKSEKIEETLAAMQKQIDDKGGAELTLRAQINELAREQMALQKENRRLKLAIRGIEQKSGRVGAPAGDFEVRKLNFGRKFRNSAEFKQWKDANPTGVGQPSLMKQGELAVFKRSFFGKGRRHDNLQAMLDGAEQKASDAIDDTTAGVLKTPFFRQDIVEQNKTIPVHRDWVNVLPVTTDEIRVRRELKEHFLVVKIKAVQTAGNDTLVLETLAGLSVEDKFKKVTINNGGGPETFDIITLTPSTNTIQLSGNLAFDVAIDDLLTSDTFIFTDEGTLKPKSLDEYEELVVKIETLATWTEATRQMVMDAVMLEDTINRKLLSKLARQEQTSFFYGPGGTGQWLGVFNDTAIPVVTWSLQAPGTSKLDLLAIGWTVVAVANHQAEACFMNPQDWRDVLLTTGTDGHYVFFQVMTVGAPPMVFTMQIVPTNGVDAGDAILGEWSLAVTLYDRMQSAIRVGEPDNMFLRNAKAILAEERVGMGIEIPAALAILDIDNEPA